MNRTRYGALLEASLRKEQNPRQGVKSLKPSRASVSKLAGKPESTPSINITWLRKREIENR
jgi:hypothetical protein